MKKVIIISSVVVFALSSCGKYEDGPMFSLLSKKSRVVNTWKLDKKFVNGTEQTLTDDDKDDYIEYKNDGTVINTNVSGNISTQVSGTWEFDSKKEYLIVTYSTSFGGFTSSTTEKYRILRLKSNEMWLEKTNNNDTYKYYYITK